jgi:hypothetical protein
MKKLVAVSAILLLVAVLGAVAIKNPFLPSSTQREEPTDIPAKTSQPENTAQQPLQPIVPKPSILRVISPTNTTYASNSIELTYTVDSKVLWSYYSIDASENAEQHNPEYPGIEHISNSGGWIHFSGNITLTLSEGPHRLRVAVQTEESRHSSVPIAYQTIDFTIDTTK